MPEVRKTRTSTTRRSTKKTSAKNTQFIPVVDITGVLLIVFGLVTLISLCAENSTGALGRYLAPVMRNSVGIGAYIIPFLIGLIGAFFIVGPLKIITRNIVIGSVMVFLSIIGGTSLARGIPWENLSSGGGYAGNILAVLARKAGGEVVGHILLGALAVVGLITIVDQPLANLIDLIRGYWIEASDNASERSMRRREARELKEAAAKNKAKDAASDSQKRSMARMFGQISDEEPEKPPKPAAVKINMPLSPKPQGIPKNGNGQNADSEESGYAEFRLPPTSLLAEPPPPPPRVESELKNNIEIIERTLEEFKVQANVVEIACGPTVARYEIQLAPGIKVNKIVGLADNLAMQLAAIDVRVEAPIPGKAAIGVEVPNKNRGIVVLREIVESKPFNETNSLLTFALGKDVAGQSIVADLAKMPHMLVGGATNAGKSVGLNSLIASLLFRATPDQLKLVLIDPKRVELSLFDGIPHLACPVVKDVKQAASVFRAVVQEMEKRYEIFSRNSVRNIDGYNERVTESERMPYMVVVVDELCDLMMQAAAEVEASVQRLTQLARATGIHCVLATQRPSVDVITGVIKANISSRMAFACSSYHDSKTILDQKGAERLVGRGDMLFLPIDAAKPTRIQGCYVSEREIEALCDYLKEQRKPVFTIQPGAAPGDGGGGGGFDDAFTDEFYEPSVRFVVTNGYCSTSMLQRKYKIGYTRAARIVDAMEEAGIVGPLDGAKPRQVLIAAQDLESVLGGKLGLPFDDSYNDDGDEEYVPHAEVVDLNEEEGQDE
ncbi:MAG: DNA translocase FtsK [Armatimonadetes bacterium]|jgi:S-DNA-T family DNA segregation ATPase FtsK/SpoIIIE|nr:DNA translocase FtsK [Armatimonadota bacterium]